MNSRPVEPNHRGHFPSAIDERLVEPNHRGHFPSVMGEPPRGAGDAAAGGAKGFRSCYDVAAVRSHMPAPKSALSAPSQAPYRAQLADAGGDEGRPFPLGASPFRTKGLFFACSQQHYDERVRGGREAFYATLTDPALRAFASQRFLASSWYDTMPLPALARAEARALGLPLAAYFRERIAWQVHHDIRGPYRFLLRLLSPETVALRLPRLVAQYSNFGSAEAHLASERRVYGERRGVPRPLAAWYAAFGETYGRHIMELAGAQACSFRALPPEADGTAHGCPTVTIAYDIRWGGSSAPPKL
jgi:hypothetical protein